MASIRKASFFAAPATAFAGWATFGIIHALWIVPIWPQMFGGLPFALAAALALAWAYAEICASERLPQNAFLAGGVFGLGVWLSLVPTTVVSNLIRATDLHHTEASWPVALEVMLAILTGAMIGRHVGRGWRPPFVLAVSAGVLLSAQGGPVPVANSTRAAGLWGLLAILYIVSGIVHAFSTRLVQHWSSRK